MSHSPEGHISITGVSKYFGRHKALDNVSLEIPPGTVTVILGPSGSGKSTLLRTINHLERVDEGFIQIDGDYIGYRRQGDKLYELKEAEILRQRVNVGYVFQNFNLFPHLTVLENLIEAPIAHGLASRKAATERALTLLDAVGFAQGPGDDLGPFLEGCDGVPHGAFLHLLAGFRRHGRGGQQHMEEVDLGIGVQSGGNAPRP